MKPTLLQDWHDEAAYPDPLSAPRRRWAWEFLRRNREYQRAWAELIAPYMSDDGFDSDRSRADLRGKGEDEDALKIMRERFGIAFVPPDPADAAILPVFETNLIVTVRGNFKKRPEEEEVLFNLEWPIGPQIIAAQHHLDRMKKHREDKGEILPEAKRNHIERWRDYLRLLDAETAGATTRRMAEIIYPEVDNVDPDYAGNRTVLNRLNAARKLRDGDYRLIAIDR